MTKGNTPIDRLHEVLDEVCTHIQDFTKSPTDFIRNRKLNAKTTLEVTLNMQGNSLNAELLDAFPNVDERMTASAYEQAKGKLTPEVFTYIFHQFNKTMPEPKKMDGKYRVFAIDGTDFTTPYNPKSDRIFNTTSEDKPICMTHANILFDIQNKTYHDCIIQPRMKMDERKAAIEMMKRLDDTTPNIVIMDRGYIGFNMIENCNRMNNLFYIIRSKVTQGSGSTEISSLPETECDVDIDLMVTSSRTFYRQNKDTMPHLHFIKHINKHYKESLSKQTEGHRWDFESRCPVRFRVVKFQINEDGKNMWEALVTNLPREEFPIERMKELYHQRWGIETSFRSLKYALGAINFHSKKDDFIDMEIFAHLVMYNVVSCCINAVNVIHKKMYAVDFKMACQIVRQYLHKRNKKPFAHIFYEIGKYINPVRPGRADKRKNNKSKSAIWFVYRVA